MASICFGRGGVPTGSLHTGYGTGPYESKAISELANNATAAAIANAVATGCHPFELPIAAERVYAALGVAEGI